MPSSMGRERSIIFIDVLVDSSARHQALNISSGD
jgi:hypothetical protein